MRSAVKGVLYAAIRGVASVVPRPSRPGLRILNYHEVRDDAAGIDNPYNQVSRHRLDEHLSLLRELGYRVIPVQELVAELDAGRAGDPPSVAISFDDGLDQHVAAVLPLLERHGARASFYVLSTGLGQPTTGVGYSGRHLAAGDLALLRQAGMEVGSHGRTHRALSRLSTDEMRTEIHRSREELGRLLGDPPPGFAYPYGSPGTIDDTVVRCVADAGYRYAATTAIGANRPSTDRHRLRRIAVYQHDDRRVLRAKVEGRLDWLGSLQARWLALAPHRATRGSAA